jgi:hypothetical protein
MLVGLFMATGAVPSHAATAPLEPLAPYRIRVFLALAPAPELTAAFARDLMSDLPDQAESFLGAAWELSVAAVPAGLHFATTTDIDTVSAEELLKRSADFDKMTLLAIAPSAAGYQVTVRELDVRTRTWNAPVTRTARHVAKLRDAAMRALLAGFAPLGTIETVDQQQVKVRLRASALAPRDPGLALLKPGDALRPVIRVNDAGGKGGQIARPAWTLLRVEQVTPEKVDCRLECGLRGIELTATRGRVESLALGVAQTGRATKLVLQSRLHPPQPLPGYDVYRIGSGDKSGAVLGRSNRDGVVQVPSGPAAMELLLVKAGDQALARLPLVPGAETEISVALPDVAPLVEAQGLLRGFQEEVVDQVTLREALIARAKLQIQAKRFDDAAETVRALKELKTRDQLAMLLAADQKRVTADDADLQHTIDSLFSETAKLLDQHFDPDLIRKLDADLKTARGK